MPEMHIYIGLGDALPWPHIHARRPLALSPFPNLSASQDEIGLQVWTAAYGQLVVQVVHRQDSTFSVPLRPDDQAVRRLYPDSPPTIDLGAASRIHGSDLATLSKLGLLLEGAPGIWMIPRVLRADSEL